MVTKWVWKCSVKGCKGHGKKPLSHSRAQFHGKLHMRNVHGDRSLEPIVKKAKA